MKCEYLSDFGLNGGHYGRRHGTLFLLRRSPGVGGRETQGTSCVSFVQNPWFLLSDAEPVPDGERGGLHQIGGRNRERDRNSEREHDRPRESTRARESEG